jgi:molecular chaperone GrpE
MMSNEQKPGQDQPRADQSGADTHATAAEAAEAAKKAAEAIAEVSGDAPPQPTHHDDLIAALRRETSDLKDKILRVQAEMENLRKRTEREKSDASKYAITRFARDIVEVGDNFQRAITAVPAGAIDNDPALKSLLDGVVMTERAFLSALERHKVARIDPMGELFNPHFHQAMMEVPKPDVVTGTVVQVFQAGFMIEDRVLRPAAVVVATGGPEPTKTPNTATGGAAASDTATGEASPEGSGSGDA